MADLIRLNKYIADRGIATRREADGLIASGRVFVNGKRAELGQKVGDMDSVVVQSDKKSHRYFAYNKPRGIITHSPQSGEKEIADVTGIPGVFPVGRLDKDSHGLIILTDDGRVTSRLLEPKRDHEKEYRVTTVQKLRPSFKMHMETGVDIGPTEQGGYVTKPCKVTILGDRLFSIAITEGKKHQIRRMCAALHVDIADLQRTRIMNIRLGTLEMGASRPIEGAELQGFLTSLKISRQN